MNTARYPSFFAIAVVALAAACSHAPQLTRHSDHVLVFRTQYLQHYSGAPFEKEIRNGEIHKSMNFMQVLAAWGLPNVRSQPSPDGNETWTYFSVDEHTSELRSYALVFTKNCLTRWVVSDRSDMSLLTLDDLSGLPRVATVPDDVPSDGGLLRARKR